MWRWMLPTALRTVAAMVVTSCWIGSAGAEAPRWSIVRAESAITAVATQLGSPFEAGFAAFSADIRFDPEQPAASLATVVIDVASYDSGNAERDTRALGPEFFDVAAHPEARFETTAFSRDDAGWVADAVLTIKGVTRRVSLPFTLRIDDGRARMAGSLEIDRGDFGVGTGEWASASSGVGRTVRIDVRLVAVRD